MWNHQHEAQPLHRCTRCRCPFWDPLRSRCSSRDRSVLGSEISCIGQCIHQTRRCNRCRWWLGLCSGILALQRRSPIFLLWCRMLLRRSRLLRYRFRRICHQRRSISRRIHEWKGEVAYVFVENWHVGISLLRHVSKLRSLVLLRVIIVELILNLVHSGIYATRNQYTLFWEIKWGSVVPYFESLWDLLRKEFLLNWVKPYNLLLFRYGVYSEDI